MPALIRFFLILSMVAGGPSVSRGQEQEPAESAPAEPQSVEETVPAPKAVNVTPAALDVDISRRLTHILEATEWFTEPEADVDEGVAFLTGTTDDERYRTWAGELARNTQDVVAVVNRIQVRQPPLWDMSASFVPMREMLRNTVRAIPTIIMALLILLLTWLSMLLCGWVADWTLLSRVDNKLLKGVLRKALLLIVLLFGIYLVLQISGLTRLATTVIGGTGLIGLIIGIAFRDIAENFLASILISMQNPFRYGDLIEVEGVEGFVQRVNTRGTLLMTLEGNHVQIPNSIIYKSKIENFTSNPKVRLDFLIGVGYDVPLIEAQTLAKTTLGQHPAVLDDPEPLVLVENLAASTVNLRLYYWIDGHKHSVLKVNSALMRQVKTAFEEQGFSMPDDAREVIFPQGVPVQMLEGDQEPSVEPAPTRLPARPRPVNLKDEETVSEAEGELTNEYNDIKRQSQQARDPEEDSTDLLADTPKHDVE